jgi:tRNA pseudouridine38-40 synthase
VAEFKEKYVYKHIAQTEKDEGIMATWLKTLNEKNYRNFAAANAREEEQEENGLEDEA